MEDELMEEGVGTPDPPPPRPHEQACLEQTRDPRDDSRAHT